MKRSYRVAKAWFQDNWQLWFVVLSGVAAVSLLLLFKLGSLTGGLSAAEYDLQQAIAHQSLSAELLLRNPLYLPYFLGLFVLQLSPFHGPTAVRSVGVVFGLLGAIGFFYVLKKWYTLRMAVFGTVMFVTSSWFLHTARYAAPEASYLLLPLLIAGMVHIQAKARAHLVLLLVTILGLLCLYIPGLIWFLAVAVLMTRKIIFASLRMQPLWFKLTIGLVGLLLLAPLVAMLVWSLGSASQKLLELLGLPSHIPSPLGIVKNAGHAVSNIFAYNSQGSLYVAGHLPWLDAASAALALIGMWRFVLHFGLARTKLIAIVGICGLVLISLGGSVPLVLLLPFVYILTVEGLKWLLNLWLATFPRNPFARGFGVTLVTILVLSIGFYHLNRYYLAWGHSTETRAVFNKVP